MAKNESRIHEAAAETLVLDKPTATTAIVEENVYANLFNKINLNTVASARSVASFHDPDSLSESSADERVTQALRVFLDMIAESSQHVDRLDKSLIDQHMASIDHKISKQLDAIMHNETFQQIESAWRGLKFLVDGTDFRKNVKIEVLDVSKDALREDFEDTPEIIQSGLYLHTYIPGIRHPGWRANRLRDFEL
jgi:type VI secretion system protein ImpC